MADCLASQTINPKVLPREGRPSGSGFWRWSVFQPLEFSYRSFTIPSNFLGAFPELIWKWLTFIFQLERFSLFQHVLRQRLPSSTDSSSPPSPQGVSAKGMLLKQTPNSALNTYETSGKGIRIQGGPVN
ncbi:uncharacterized protein LOC119765997 [Culex quinquefasciatus]|uniref:uncharacterized protein LOC119765997 n=1 Tax=Culex quinquefasciatus TaxID=7176 RepID=UPI0018E3A6BD|nr:uncharacterized protein LOC119765997 [Culex quinquefasciatus]